MKEDWFSVDGHKKRLDLGEAHLLKKLRLQNAITPEVENLIAYLTLEDLIALKLIITFESSLFKLQTIPVMNTSVLKNIVKRGIMKFIISYTLDLKSAAKILGVWPVIFKQKIKELDMEEYYKYFGIQIKKEGQND